MSHKAGWSSMMKEDNFSSSKNGRLCFLLPETANSWNRSSVINSVVLSAFNYRIGFENEVKQIERMDEPWLRSKIVNFDNIFYRIGVPVTQSYIPPPTFFRREH